MKLKHIIRLLAFFVLGLSVLWAQDDELAKLGFEETEFQEEEEDYFVVGGGLLMGAGFLNPDDLNIALTDGAFGFDDEFSSPLFTIGGEGMIAIGFLVPNMRLAFSGKGAFTSLERELVVEGTDVTRTMDYSFGVVGIYGDYAIRVTRGLAILPGVGLGWGSININSYQGPKNSDWADFVPQNDNVNYYNKIDGTFWFVEPRLNIEYALTPFFMLRLSTSYSLYLDKPLISDPWKLNGNSTLENVPDSMKDGVFHVQLGIFLGLFNF